MNKELSGIVKKAIKRNKVKMMLPRSAERAKEEDLVELSWIQGADKNFFDKLDLPNKSLEELAEQYRLFTNQTQYIKGRILLEGRARFTDSKKGTELSKGSLGFDKAGFGKWIKDNELDTDSEQARDNFMNLAEFFRHRSLDKIVVSAAYKLSMPKYSAVADDVYKFVKGKNIAYKDILAMLDKRLSEKKQGIPFTPLSGPQAKLAIPVKTIAGAQTVTTEQTITISGGFENAQNIQIGTVTATQGTSLGDLMPIDVLKMASDYKETSGAATIIEDGLEIVPDDSPAYALKLSLSEDEKIQQVKELINILAFTKWEAGVIAEEVYNFFSSRLI